MLEKEKKPIKDKVKTFRLQGPDLSLLALSQKLKVQRILTDDLELRKAAEALGLETHGSLGIVLRAYKRKRLSLAETKSALADLFNISSLYVSPKLFHHVLAGLSEEKKT